MSDIGDLYAAIERYEGYIEELREYYDNLKRLRDEIHREHYVPDKDYDMTFGDKFLGIRKDDAVLLQDKIAKTTRGALGDIDRVLQEILNAIDRLHELIEECRAKISELEAAENEPVVVE